MHSHGAASGQLIESEQEQATITLIRKLRCAGRTFSEIQAMLHANNVKNRRRNTNWSVSQIHKLAAGGVNPA